MNTNILKNRTTRITTLVLTLASLIFLGIFTQSCSNEELFDSRSFDIENGTSNISEIGIGDFKNWFNSQQIESELVEKKKLDWDNAEIKLMPDGKSTKVTFTIYQGRNSSGNDSIRELHIAYVGNSFMGGIMAFSYNSKKSARVDYYNLSGRLLQEWAYYAPKQVYSLLKIYPNEGSLVRLKSSTEEDDPCTFDVDSNSRTPYYINGIANSNASNCHTHVFGVSQPTDPMYSDSFNPNFPLCNNYPNIDPSVYSEVSTPQVGDIWVSFGKTTLLGNDTRIHSAFVKEVIDGKITKVEGKCGEDEVKIYDPDCGQYLHYKTDRIKYYREQ